MIRQQIFNALSERDVGSHNDCLSNKTLSNDDQETITEKATNLSCDLVNEIKVFTQKIGTFIKLNSYSKVEQR